MKGILPSRNGAGRKKEGGVIWPWKLATLVLSFAVLGLLIQNANSKMSHTFFTATPSNHITRRVLSLESGEALSLIAPEDANKCSTELAAVKAEIEQLRKTQAENVEGGVSIAEALDPNVDVAKLSRDYIDLKKAFNRLLTEKANLEGKGVWRIGQIDDGAQERAAKLVEECGKQSSGLVLSNINAEVWKGYACEATEEDLKAYFDYTPRGPCPDDWFFVQDLIYVKNCFALPKRRCLNRTPQQIVPPNPFPSSLFDQTSLNDANVRWDLHHCKSFECLNTRSLGDCRNCFNFTLENNRWKSNYRGSLKMSEVIELTKGTLRIGLDVGGGTGSFAAHMARFNVTILTTAFNVETVPGRRNGLPYMEAIALRGLVPLHSPHKARLPFYDNTLDIIHCVNSVKYLPMLEFEELIFEWNRVLRPGGVIWFEMFYTPEEEMPLYISVLDLLKYKRLYWNITPKPDAGERHGSHVYLNALIEKQVLLD